MSKTTLAIDLLRIDGNTQSRVKINEDAVEDYAAALEAAGTEWPFPPVSVFHDGTNYFVADGFHRVLAAQRAKRGSVPCEVHKGTATDAHIYGMTANDRHGLRMTRADKRACVVWLLDNQPKRTQVQIAELAGVTKRTVQMVVADRAAKMPAGNCKKAQIAPSSAEPAGAGKDGVRQTGETHADVPAARETPTDKETVDYGQCPNCAGTKWDDTDDGVVCAKCLHPHGEPTGGPDERRVRDQRSKTIKTAEALQRAFDDLHMMVPRPQHAEASKKAKELLKLAREWK